jgi:hypothetical protein
LAQLAIHIIAKSKPLKDWYESILKRFTSLYLATDDDLVGPPVPMEALNPDIKFDIGMTDDLLARFVKNLDYHQNPYLRTPKQMVESGFKGNPYTYTA